MRHRQAITLLVLSITPAAVVVHEGQSEFIEELIVYARSWQMISVAQAASEGIVGYDDIQLPSLMRAGELVEAVPGMTATHHTGTGKANPVARSNGGEFGLRLESGETLNVTLAAFWLELDSDLLFVGDARTTVVNDGSERLGVELSAFWQPADWLAANFACTFTDSKLKFDQGGGRKIPGAIVSTAVLGVNGTWANGVFGNIRVRYLGDAPLVEDNSVRSSDSLFVNAGVGYRWNNVEFRLDGFNLLDSDDNDISYFFASRLEGELIAGAEDVHSRRLEPRSVRASISPHWE